MPDEEVVQPTPPPVQHEGAEEPHDYPNNSIDDDRDDVDDNRKGSNSDESEEEEDESEDEPIESLVQGRDRRSTQGNRYTSLLEQETAGEDGDDDDLALLFAEADEEDVEFEDPDAANASDVADDDSSTDDEDQGPAAGDSDLEGEEQLKKEEKAAKKIQKRKADKVLVPAAARKKVKIDESATPSDATATAAANRRRKMSERISWVPTGPPARTSSRTLSVQNKVRTIASMKESESRRIRQIAIMEAAQKRKDANKAKPLTQAERMAEAAETERINSQSLNKWEEMEKERVKKQKSRLEAMQNRKIEGPSIQWYSAKGEWGDGKLKRVGKHLVTEVVEDKSGEVPKKRTWKRRTRPGDEDASKDLSKEGSKETAKDDPKDDSKDTVEEAAQLGTVQPSESEKKSSSPSSKEHLGETVSGDGPVEEQLQDQGDLPAENQALKEQTKDLDQDIPEARDLEMSESKDNEEDPSTAAEDLEILETKDRAQDVDTAGTQDQDEGFSSSKHQDQEDESSGVKDTSQPQDTTQEDQGNVSEIAGQDQPQLSHHSPENNPPSTNNEAEQTATLEVTSETPLDSATGTPKVIEYSTRNSITLQNFDSVSIQDLSVLRHIVMGTPFPNNFTPSAPSSRANARSYNHLPPKPIQPVCAISGQPAKYRDPVTGLPYSSVEAYKAIRKLMDGGGVWSNLLGAWCGGDGKMLTTGGAARGVPEGFFSPKVVVESTVETDGPNRDVKTEAA